MATTVVTADGFSFQDFPVPDRTKPPTSVHHVDEETGHAVALNVTDNVEDLSHLVLTGHLPSNHFLSTSIKTSTRYLHSCPPKYQFSLQIRQSSPPIKINAEDNVSVVSSYLLFFLPFFPLPFLRGGCEISPFV